MTSETVDAARYHRILTKLAESYPDAKCALEHKNPFELLVATVLSAQSTDKKVNEVTRHLFSAYPTPERFATAQPADLYPYIQVLGLFRNKAKHLVAIAQKLVAEHGGKVPQEREALEQLPGVGRKTANVVLSNAYGIPAIAVDTHVFRVANRLGLARAKTPEETERQLMERIPRELWSQAHHWLIHHGRQVCSAKKPLCHACPLADDCDFFRRTAPAASGEHGQRSSSPDVHAAPADDHTPGLTRPRAR
ncbi:MAG TPA: endonuclease III [Limnochordia bacterium]